MWTKKFWQSTAEWMLTAAAGAVLSAWQSGIHNWGDVGQAVGIAAGTALLKCLLATAKGDPASPALVEPKA